MKKNKFGFLLKKLIRIKFSLFFWPKTKASEVFLEFQFLKLSITIAKVSKTSLLKELSKNSEAFYSTAILYEELKKLISLLPPKQM